jgi:hypothetical protein
VEISSLSSAELRAHYTSSDGFFKGEYLYTDSMYINITPLLILHESQKNSHIDTRTKIECTIRKLLALTSIYSTQELTVAQPLILPYTLFLDFEALMGADTKRSGNTTYDLQNVLSLASLPQLLFCIVSADISLYLVLRATLQQLIFPFLFVQYRL